MKNLALVILVLAFLAVGFLILKNKKSRKEEIPLVICPEFEPLYTGKENIENSEGVDMESLIKIGDYGTGVFYAQDRLINQYGASINRDGKFGCETYYAMTELTGMDSEKGIDLNDLK